jgi:hypothetical protein
MSRLIWDAVGEKFYEMGTKMGVLYPMNNTGAYDKGVAWNGLTAVTESPSGAEETKLYADDIKYASLRSAEEYGYTIEAYTYPTEWEPCDGSAQVATGVSIGQQKRQGFGFSWVTTVGNDVDDEVGQKIHIAWNSTASPSEKSYATINDNPDAITFSWECTTSPVSVTHQPHGDRLLQAEACHREGHSGQALGYRERRGDPAFPRRADQADHRQRGSGGVNLSPLRSRLWRAPCGAPLIGEPRINEHNKGEEKC